MIQDYIDGKWVNSFGNTFVPVVNPANGQELAVCPLGTAADVDRAVQSAEQAFKSWRQVPVVERIQYFFQLKTLLDSHLEEIAKHLRPFVLPKTRDPHHYKG